MFPSVFLKYVNKIFSLVHLLGRVYTRDQIDAYQAGI